MNIKCVSRNYRQVTTCNNEIGSQPTFNCADDKFTINGLKMLYDFFPLFSVIIYTLILFVMHLKTMYEYRIANCNYEFK